MRKERDKFLQVAMGKCWHERKDFSDDGYGTYSCKHCGAVKDFAYSNLNPDFSTWNGFGVLYPWAMKQGWFFDMKFWSDIKGNTQYAIADVMIEPELFANTVYSYLKRKEIGCLSSKL